MIKGKRKGENSLVWSSKGHGGPRDRLHIESKTYDVVFTALDKKLFGNHSGKLEISRRGKYRYEPSERYKKFLASMHKVPMKRVRINELSNF